MADETTTSETTGVAESTVAEDASGKAKVTYVGPPNQTCPAISGQLETGKTYDVSAEVAKKLVASSVHWKSGKEH